MSLGSTTTLTITSDYAYAAEGAKHTAKERRAFPANASSSTSKTRSTPRRHPNPSHSPKPRGHAHHAPRAYPTSTVHMGRCEGGGSFDIGSISKLGSICVVSAHRTDPARNEFCACDSSLDRSSRFIRY